MEKPLSVVEETPEREIRVLKTMLEGKAEASGRNQNKLRRARTVHAI